jgi:predicted nucleic acid-binding protein
MRNIIDTGPLVYRFDKTESAVGQWSRALFRSKNPPFFTCEAVLTEAAYMTTPELISRMVKDGDLVVDFALQEEIEHVHRLLAQYPRMDLADACLVRMSEITPDCQIFTIDRHDFSVYRRFRNKPVPAIFPD